MLDLEEVDLILIDPLPSYVWYQDMVDFAEGISDHAVGARLSRSLQGKGAFRRFRNQLYDRHPELISTWQTLRDARARHRAVQFLVDEGLVEVGAAQRFTTDHPEPDRPGGQTTTPPKGRRAPVGLARHSVALFRLVACTGRAGGWR